MDRYPTPAIDNALTYEEAIVWLEDVSGQPYIREEIWVIARWRRRPLLRSAGRVVGYSMLRPDALSTGPAGTFTRRIFWLAAHDPYAAGAPYEAVAPASVVPGRRGVPPWQFYELDPDIGPFKAFIESLGRN